jgi:hypothetical protein
VEEPKTLATNAKMGKEGKEGEEQRQSERRRKKKPRWHTAHDETTSPLNQTIEGKEPPKRNPDETPPKLLRTNHVEVPAPDIGQEQEAHH